MKIYNYEILPNRGVKDGLFTFVTARETGPLQRSPCPITIPRHLSNKEWSSHTSELFRRDVHHTKGGGRIGDFYK